MEEESLHICSHPVNAFPEHADNEGLEGFGHHVLPGSQHLWGLISLHTIQTIIPSQSKQRIVPECVHK